MRFVQERANSVAAMLGPNPPQLDKESIAQIKNQVDSYAARRDSLSTEASKEGLRPVYSRASIYAPFITQAFNERHVPPVIGLYIAMIESEYHPCRENRFGGEGLFGFISKTAMKYGVAPQERCDPRKTSRAAARYMDDLMSEFGSDSASVALAIIGYNIGEGQTREFLHTLLNNGIRDRDYWALAAHADMFSEKFRQENIKYVPRFFAAAIVGENPQTFDLQIQPLSIYTKVPEQPQS
jgi:hypothetical protein